MKKYLLILTLIFTACKTNFPNKKPEYQIVKVQISAEKESVSCNELRFYKIKSSMDTMKMMYETYGNWDLKVAGKHQDNIKKIIWANKKLLENEEETFTIITDGTETMIEYFACLIVLDSEGNDCFEEKSPYKEKLMDLFISKMNETDDKYVNYNKFK